MYVLDSDILTHFHLGNAKIAAKVAQVLANGDFVVTTIITQCEVLQGRISALMTADTHDRFLKAQQQFFATQAALGEIRILELDQTSLLFFDKLSALKGVKKIGRADQLIAAIALARRSVLVTRNLKHLRRIPNLLLDNWMD